MFPEIARSTIHHRQKQPGLGRVTNKRNYISFEIELHQRRFSPSRALPTHPTALPLTLKKLLSETRRRIAHV